MNVSTVEKVDDQTFKVNAAPSFLMRQNGKIIGHLKLDIKFGITINQAEESEAETTEEINSNSLPEIYSKMLNDHLNCRSDDAHNLKAYYTNIFRCYVPNEKVKWSVVWPDYKPEEFSMSNFKRKKPRWVDPVDPSMIKNWNTIDYENEAIIDRRSYVRNYRIVNNRPLNPVGRTGISGRGRLGRWGANHCTDSLITKWKRDSFGCKVMNPYTKKYVLQVLCVKRKDTGEWSLPGVNILGICDIGSSISLSLDRLVQSSIDLDNDADVRKLKRDLIKNFFKKGDLIYKGYVDDPRNTDNSWIESVVYLFHDNTGKIIDFINLKSDEEILSIQWISADECLNFYLNQKEYLKNACEKLGSHWSIKCKNENYLTHYKCRSFDPANLKIYQQNLNKNNVIKRQFVPDEFLKWNVEWSDYKPAEFSPKTEDIADSVNSNEIKSWNKLENGIDRRSNLGDYMIRNDRPLNPVGRTGVCGKGLLARWGPNHCLEIIITKLKKDANGIILNHENSKLPLLEFLAVKKRGQKFWEIPKAILSPNETSMFTAHKTLFAYFKNEEKTQLEIKGLFDNSTQLSQGYLDDEKNTDNAWVESSIIHLHDSSNLFDSVEFKLTDNIEEIKWLCVDHFAKFYLNRDLSSLEIIADKLQSHWRSVNNLVGNVPKHYLCRFHDLKGSANYLDFLIERVYVPDSVFTWDSCSSFYFDTVLTYNNEKLKEKVYADEIQPQKINFKKVERQSHLNYEVKEFPLNPIGPTGLHGRGLLGKWGPNHMGYLLITRWKRCSKTLDICKNATNEKQILEFVAVVKNMGWFQLPNASMRFEPNPNVESINNFFVRYFSCIKEKKRLKDTEIIHLLPPPSILYKGYVDDPRNTDHAWIEAKVFHYHDALGKFDKSELIPKNSIYTSEWKTLEPSSIFTKPTWFFLKNVADLYNASWN